MRTTFRVFFPALLVLFFLCASARADKLAALRITGQFNQMAPTTELTAPNASFVLRWQVKTPLRAIGEVGDRFESSAFTIEQNLGGKVSSFVVKGMTVGTDSMRMVLVDGQGEILLDFKGSPYLSSVPTPRFAFGAWDLTQATLSVRIGINTRVRVPFTGQLVAIPLPDFVPNQLYSFSWLKAEGDYIRHLNRFGEKTQIASDQDRKDATFRLVRGLTGDCFSLESLNNPRKYLRHKDGRIRLDANDGGQFTADATFCELYGPKYVKGFSFVSYNTPGCYIGHINGHLVLMPFQDSADFADAVTLTNEDPLWDPAMHPDINPAPPAPVEAEGIDTNSYYRLTNAQFGDGESLEVKPPTQFRSAQLSMAQTSDNNGQYWMFLRKGMGYQLANAATGKSTLLTVDPRVFDSPSSGGGLAMNPTPSGLVLEFTPLGDGYYILGRGSVLGLIKGDPAMVPAPVPGKILPVHKWKLTRIGPVR